MDARVRGTEPFRAAADRPRHHRPEVLVAGLTRRATAAVPRARGHTLQAAQAESRGLAKPEKTRRLRDRRGRYAGAYAQGERSLAPGAGQQQALRAPRGSPL